MVIFTYDSTYARRGVGALLVSAAAGSLVMTVIASSNIVSLSRRSINAHRDRQLYNTITRLLTGTGLAFSQLSTCTYSINPNDFANVHVNISAAGNCIITYPGPLVTIGGLRTVTGDTTGNGGRYTFVSTNGNCCCTGCTSNITPYLIPCSFTRARPSIPLYTLTDRCVSNLYTVIHGGFTTGRFSSSLIPICVHHDRTRSGLTGGRATRGNTGGN